MKITQFNSISQVKNAYNKDIPRFTVPKNIEDRIDIRKDDISVLKTGKSIHVSFSGRLQNPLENAETGIQFKIAGVTTHQKGSPAAHRLATDDNLVKLAESDWKVGKELDYEINSDKNVIELIDKDFGGIGNVPMPINEKLKELIAKDKENFKFELSNITGGVTSDFPIIAAKASLKYTGENSNLNEMAKEEFNNLINSSDSKISSSVEIYQPNFSPKEVLSKIFDIEGKRKGLGQVRKIKDAIDTIATEINNPKNKNILVVGHCNPDGDTIGCVLGMQAAIKGAFPERTIDMSIDDEIPNSFRNLPGFNDIKRPFNEKAYNSVKKNIELLERNKDSQAAKNQIALLNQELEKLTDESKLFDPETVEGKNPKKYDLVIMLDTPIPGRTSSSFKPYFKNADKIIYIDHHPHKPAEWEQAEFKTGLDMDKICKDKLALVVDSIPAATQLVAVIADKASLLQKTFQNSADKAKQFVAGLIAGTQTDTANYKVQAAYHASETSLPQSEKATYYPEGMSNWLSTELDSVGGGIDKKWMRENLFYELPNQTINDNVGPRDKVLEVSLKNREMNPEIGLGIVKVSYDEMKAILEDAQKIDKNVSMNDVYNGFKYSEILNALKAKPAFKKETTPPETLAAKAAQTYTSAYDDDRVVVLMTETQKQGTINKYSEIADKNLISLSIRSGGKSNAAQIIGALFGGGGHAAASGASILMKDLTFDSKLKVKINGVVEDDSKTIYDTLVKNINLSERGNISTKGKSLQKNRVELVMSDDDEGKTCSELINDITSEIRQKQKMPKKVFKKYA